MTRFFLFAYFILISFISTAQNDPEAVVRQQSNDLLHKTTPLVAEQQSLKKVLIELRHRYDINLTYADEKVADISVSDINHQGNLAELLDILLSGSSLTYIVAGDMVVLTTKKINPENETTAKDSGSKDTNSIHIYQPQRMDDLPWTLRRKLNHHYRKSLKKAAHRLITQSDSIEYHPVKMSLYRFSISAFAGWQGYTPLLTDQYPSVDWQEKMKHELSLQNSFKAGATITIPVYQDILFHTGFSAEQVAINTQWKQKKGPKAKPPPQSSAGNTTVYDNTSKNLLISMPFHALYAWNFDNYFLMAGTGLDVSFSIPGARGDNHYEELDKDITSVRIEEHYTKLLLGTTLQVKGGYLYNQNTAFHLNISYRHFITPIYKSSLYKLSPNGISITLGISRFIW